MKIAPSTDEGTCPTCGGNHAPECCKIEIIYQMRKEGLYLAAEKGNTLIFRSVSQNRALKTLVHNEPHLLGNLREQLRILGDSELIERRITARV